LGGQAVYPLWWPPTLTKGMQTEQILCWIGMADTEHTSGSNEEERSPRFIFELPVYNCYAFAP